MKSDPAAISNLFHGWFHPKLFYTFMFTSDRFLLNRYLYRRIHFTCFRIDSYHFMPVKSRDVISGYILSMNKKNPSSAFHILIFFHMPKPSCVVVILTPCERCCPSYVIFSYFSCMITFAF